MTFIHGVLAVILSTFGEVTVSFSHVHLSDLVWFDGEAALNIDSFIENIWRVESLYSCVRTFFI
jgi:hypothetical protein